MTKTPVPLLRATVYGGAEVDADDPAELYHEASRLYPGLLERQAAGIERLMRDRTLQDAADRPGRANPQLAAVALDPGEPPAISLWDAIALRRSEPPSPRAPLGVRMLARLLVSGYGETRTGRRTVPSGGALYPLELYVVARRVGGLPSGVYRFDWSGPALEVLERDDLSEQLHRAVPMPELVESASAVLFLAATFWRTRFKYGLRGYRFALLEAGHAAQNVLLAAAALGVSALPLGGFYDARVDALLGIDGVEESSLYGVVLGGDER